MLGLQEKNYFTFPGFRNTPFEIKRKSIYKNMVFRKISLYELWKTNSSDNDFSISTNSFDLFKYVARYHDSTRI